MARNYSNFIQAFATRNKDNFVPNKFYLWAGISVVAAALERKVWLPWNTSFSEYPNMYVFLISRPGIGKSSAIRPATNMLRDLNKEYGKNLRLLPNKITEPKLLDILGDTDMFEYKGEWQPHTSVYYAASEASACFHDPYGGFAQTVTALYDGDNMTKATVSRKNLVEVINPCMNVIAGATFDYLARLLTTEGVLGGFASRLTYVVHDKVAPRKSSWQGRNEVQDTSIDYKKLLADLADINSMVGPFKASEDFASAWEEWFPKFDKAQQEAPNEKMQSLLVRKQTMMRKLPLILCASENSSRVLELRHWEMALKLMNEVESSLPAMIRRGQAQQVGTQVGSNNAIIDLVEHGIRNVRDIRKNMLARGFEPERIDQTMGSMTRSGDLVIDQDGNTTLVGNTDIYL